MTEFGEGTTGYAIQWLVLIKRYGHKANFEVYNALENMAMTHTGTLFQEQTHSKTHAETHCQLH